MGSPAGGGYYVVTAETNLIAFVLPADKAQRASFRIVGAHTDSPNLRLKPNAEYVKEGYAQLGVEVYGGVLLNSWLDRDLGIAGRVLVRDGGAITSKLVSIAKPLLRVPQLAIHLDREVNDKGLVLNKQDHMAPIYGLAATARLRRADRRCGAASSPTRSSSTRSHAVRSRSRRRSAARDEEFIFSARLDNLAMSPRGDRARSRRSTPPSAISVVALFDHEEVGSDSAAGARQRRACRASSSASSLGRSHATFLRALRRARSASPPTWPTPFTRTTRAATRRATSPSLNGGPVIKINAQQRYATTAEHGGAVRRALRARPTCPSSSTSHRTDLPCGSTIGPITSTLLGIATVDVGNPMLSMHSSRELAGAAIPR